MFMPFFILGLFFIYFRYILHTYVIIIINLLMEFRGRKAVMDKKSQRIISIILYASIIFTFGFSITFNAQNKVVLGILSSILIVTVSVRYMLVYPSDKYYSLGRIMILFDIALIYWIVLIDKSGISQFYLLALFCDVILNTPTSYSIIITAVSYFSYIASVYIREGHPRLTDFIPFALLSASTFLFVFGIIYLSKYQILQRVKLSAALKEIKLKNSQLETAYEKLKHTSKILEEVTVLKERNRIAREIHDTVGHTLTTVLVEIEAGRRLLSKNTELAQQKFELAQEQVRKGLTDIRHSVKLLKDRGNILEFIPAIESLILETRKHAGVEIECELPSYILLNNDVEKILYNALLEGITNGIKHGNSTKFTIKLSLKDDEVNLLVKNNGTGCENVMPGFGLTSMKDRVESCGGTLDIYTRPEDGFRIEIKIPLKE
jgi:signal transduction histidine kinase